VTLVGFIMFPLLNYKNAEEFNTQEKLMIAMMRDAQQRSIHREQSKRWGVRFTNNVTGDDTFELFKGPSATGGIYSPCSAITVPTITSVEKKTLKSSSEFQDPAPGCIKDIVFISGSGVPVPKEGSTQTINKVIIVPKGFTIPPKTIVVYDIGTIDTIEP